MEETKHAWSCRLHATHGNEVPSQGPCHHYYRQGKPKEVRACYALSLKVAPYVTPTSQTNAGTSQITVILTVIQRSGPMDRWKNLSVLENLDVCS